MAKTNTKWPALESVFAELTDAITRKKFTKARRLAGQIEFNVVMAWHRNELSRQDQDVCHTRLEPLWASISPKPKRAATKRERDAAIKQSMYTRSKSDFYTAS